MPAYHVIDRETWHRREHFEFYRTFANPSFNLCVPLEAQRLYECAKDRQVSFFQLALYALLRAANAIPELKQRMLGDEIIEYDELAVMTPVMTAQEGFRQVWCDNAADFAAFSRAATPSIEAAKNHRSGAAYRQRRALLLRQLPAVAAFQRHHPCRILCRRRGARPHLGQIEKRRNPGRG
nr:Chloramphenicol acetyltransferase [Raoultella sp. NCTC 9187]